MKKIALVTGASAGIGLATAQFLAQEGYIVYGAARRIDRLQELKKDGVKPIALDVTNDQSMQSAVETIIAEQGRIDILINNAGFGSYGAIEDVSMEDAKHQLEVNLFGAARMTQLVLPFMRKHRFGKIVNISSIGGKIAIPFGGWYHTSKFAMEGFSDSLRNEVKQFGIDVIVIEPGGIKSEWAGIARESLLKQSGHTAYAKLATAFAIAGERTTEKNPPATVIAHIIKQAIEKKKPKTRYSGGYLAKPLLFLRKLLSDRAMDKLIMSGAKQASKA